MSGKYQKPYTIPEGFPALLKAFTREILREQVRLMGRMNACAVLCPCKQDM